MIIYEGQKIENGIFPNKETYVDIPHPYPDSMLKEKSDHELDVAEVTMIFEGNDDLINLMLLKRALDDQGVKIKVDLFAPFFPYMTMDRTEDTRALSCKYISEFVNRLGFRTVTIWEAHSPVVLATLDRVINANGITIQIAYSAMEQNNLDEQNALIVFPDDGAAKRYEKAFKGFKTVTVEKKRDFETGKIIDSKIAHGAEYIQPGMTAVIVDDLCRGGWTFMNAAKLLKAQGLDKVILCVTHAEEGMFKGEMYNSGIVDLIYTTDTCCSAREDPRVHFESKVRVYE